jgi:glyoxylase-like metal-dependent hydrolase (beta-lactamase superfamily II)
MNELPGLRWLLAPNPSPMTLDGTRTYLVGIRRVVVIDPGPALDTHLDRLIEAIAGRPVEAVVVTHGHSDHADAAAPLAGAIGATVLRLQTPEAANARDFERLVREGDEIQTDAGELHVIGTPGHAPDHIAVHWTGGLAPAAGAVFVGDLLMGQGDTTLVAYPEGDLAEYLASLARIEALTPACLFPAHGPPIVDPEDAIRRYRHHREQRIAQVRSLRSTRPDATPDQLVDLVYGTQLDPRLRSAARGSIEAIDRYLRIVD